MRTYAKRRLSLGRLWPVWLVAIATGVILAYFPGLVASWRPLLGVDVFAVFGVWWATWSLTRSRRARDIQREAWLRESMAARMRGDDIPEKPWTLGRLFRAWLWRRRRELAPVVVVFTLLPFKLSLSRLPAVFVLSVVAGVFVGLAVWVLMVDVDRRGGAIAGAVGVVVWLAVPWPGRIAWLIAVLGCVAAVWIRWRHFRPQPVAAPVVVDEDPDPTPEQTWEMFFGAEGGLLPGSRMVNVQPIMVPISEGE